MGQILLAREEPPKCSAPLGGLVTDGAPEHRITGFEGIEHMPPRLASFAVSVATLAAGVIALSLADHDSGGLPLSLLGLPLAAVFLARGIVGYTPWWTSKTPEPNFRLNDTRVYSPLCLFLGAGFVALVIMRLI